MKAFVFAIASVLIGSVSFATQNLILPPGATMTLGDYSITCQQKAVQDVLEQERPQGAVASAPLTVVFTTCECRDRYNSNETLYQIKQLSDGSRRETKIGVYRSADHLGKKCTTMIQESPSCR